MRRRVIGLVLLLPLSISLASAQQVDLDGKAIGRARLYERYFCDASAIHGVDARILWTIGYVESRFNPGLISPQGARGLMQLLPTTAARFGVANPHEPVGAINAAAKYLRML